MKIPYTYDEILGLEIEGKNILYLLFDIFIDLFILLFILFFLIFRFYPSLSIILLYLFYSFFFLLFPLSFSSRFS